jgi:hypothetical protein
VEHRKKEDKKMSKEEVNKNYGILQIGSFAKGSNPNGFLGLQTAA